MIRVKKQRIRFDTRDKKKTGFVSGTADSDALRKVFSRTDPVLPDWFYPDPDLVFLDGGIQICDSNLPQ